MIQLHREYIYSICNIPKDHNIGTIECYLQYYLYFHAKGPSIFPKGPNMCWTFWAIVPTLTPFISPNSQSLRTEHHFQFIRFAAAILQCASVCFHTEHRISAFWKVRFKKRSKIEQKDNITPMHCLAFPSALFGAPFHIDNRTVADCGFWLEYASKTPLEVVADLPHRMRLFWLRCQIMRLRSVHIKPHYSQNAFDSALLAWYERGIYHCMLPPWFTIELYFTKPKRHEQETEFSPFPPFFVDVWGLPGKFNFVIKYLLSQVRTCFSTHAAALGYLAQSVVAKEVKI